MAFQFKHHYEWKNPWNNEGIFLDLVPFGQLGGFEEYEIRNNNEVMGYAKIIDEKLIRFSRINIFYSYLIATMPAEPFRDKLQEKYKYLFKKEQDPTFSLFLFSMQKESKK